MPRIRPSALARDLLLRGVWEGLGTPECLVTGGYVRDTLLGRTSVDLDLVVPGSLEAARGPAQRLAARLDGNAHVLGREDKRVWRIETPDLKVELWPLGGLHLEADIQRRDFSVNALMWPLPDGPIVDLIDGMTDLKQGSLRALRKKNLQDDPVRLVRAARFLAQFPEFALDGRTAGWIRSLAPSVRHAPQERLGQEFLKLVAMEGRERGLRALLELGLLQRAAHDRARFDGPWAIANLHAMGRMRPSAHPLRAALAAAGDAAPLAVLLRAWGAPDPDATAHFAWPRHIRIHAARAASILETMLGAVDGGAAERREIIHRTGTAFPASIALAAAVEPDRHWKRWWRQWRSHGEELIAATPLITGEAISRLLGLEPGPELGRAVDALVRAQVRGEVRTVWGAEKWLRRWHESSAPRLWDRSLER